MFNIYNSKAQTCEDLINYIKSESNGTTYTSYDSDVISKVTYYQISNDYNTLYFTKVCFKQKYSHKSNKIYIK